MGFVEFLRQYAIKNERDESPLFSLQIGSNILAGSYYVFNLQQKPYSKYIPFNYLYIANRSEQNIEVIINDDIIKKISANTIESFDYNTVKAIRTLKIKNIGVDTINKEDLEVLIQKQKVRLIDKV